MSNRTLFVSVILFFSIAIAAIIVHAQDENGSDVGVKSHGVEQNIAEDRQVERVGGIYQPEGLDKYIKRKFDALNEKIETLENKVDQLSGELKKVTEKKPSLGVLATHN